MIYSLCLLLFVIGLYAAVTKRNTVKIVIGLGIMEYAVNLFLVLLGYRRGGSVPILERGTNLGVFLATAVDPLPQALVLTSIVIGLGIMSMAIALCIRLYEKYGTFDIAEIRRLRG